MRWEMKHNYFATVFWRDKKKHKNEMLTIATGTDVGRMSQ